MPAFSLVYVSHGLVVLEDEPGAIEDIVSTAVERNGREGITGALLYTDDHFVQILEGPEAAVRLLMEGIRCDPRHEQVAVLETIAETPRMFEHWSMAYLGEATFAKSAVGNLLDAGGSPARRAEAIRHIRRLMREFVHGSH